MKKLTSLLIILLVLALVLIVGNVHATSAANKIVEEQDHEGDNVEDEVEVAVNDHQESLDSNNISPIDDDADDNDDEDDNDNEQKLYSPQQQHGIGRVLVQKNKKQKMKRPRRLTCNKFPRICGAIGSPGPHCCKKKCVNVLIDRNNCGMCGKKCKFNQLCCGGKCVNPSFNKRHCGGCNNRCQEGGFCAFGLCSYA